MRRMSCSSAALGTALWAGSRTADADTGVIQSPASQRVRRPMCVSWQISAAPCRWMRSAKLRK